MEGVASVHPIGVDVRCPTCGERFPPDYAVCPRDATPLGVGVESVDPLIGRILAGSYRIIKVLAQGGMGRLYEAEHTRLPRRLAVKVIHDVYAGHRDAVARFEREARAAALVDSPHVVAVVDVARTEDDRPCIVYERLEGEDLGRRIARDGALPVHDAVEIAAQMAEGLLAAHLAGIIHRDLKPSNVFLAARPGTRLSVTLLDFGVAKLLDAPEITRTGAVIGTPAYMAPEQARGEEDIDARADLYGLGAVLYKMVSGRAPFDARDATASLTALLAGPPRPIAALVPELPADLIRLIEDTMARDSKDRPESAREVLARLRVIAEGLGDAAHPTERPASGNTSASAEATTVMPAGVVHEVAARRTALTRARPRALCGVLLAALTLSGATAILTVAAMSASIRVTVAVFVTTLVATGIVFARRTRRLWAHPEPLAALPRALAKGATLAFGVLGALTFIAALMSSLSGAGALPTATLFASALALALLTGSAVAGHALPPTPTVKRTRPRS